MLQPAGLYGYTHGGFCEHQFKDGGKRCGDGGACESKACLARQTRSGDASKWDAMLSRIGRAVGTCSASDYSFGCKNYVVKGRITGIFAD